MVPTVERARKSDEKRTLSFFSFFFSELAGVDEGAISSEASDFLLLEAVFDFLAGGGVGSRSRSTQREIKRAEDVSSQD